MNFDYIMEKENELKENDLIEILKIRDELKKYNMIDFLKNISALMLFPINQSKSVIFECMISTALSIPKDEQNEDNIMSVGKFRKIVTKFLSLHRAVMIDPPEFPFVLPVIYYNNYHIFMGSNSISSIDFNIMLKTLMINRNKLGEKLYIKISRLVQAFLELSEKVYIRTKIDFMEMKSFDKDEDIFIPNLNILNQYKNYIKFSREDIYFLFNNEEIEEFKCDLGDVEIKDINNYEDHLFFDKPIIAAENEFIVLDITTIITLVMKTIVKYIKKECDFDIINEYNKGLTMQVEESFAKLGNFKINFEQYKIDLVRNENYIENLYSSGNDGIIINIVLFDYGNNKKWNTLLSEDFIAKRIELIKTKLIEKKFDDYKITTIVTPNIINQKTKYSLKNCDMSDIIILSPYEIDSISINESNQNMFFQRYLIARKKLKFYEKNMFSELNTIVLYITNDYSFYINDSVDTKEVSISIIGEYSSDYILKAYIREQKHLCQGIKDNTKLEVIKYDENIFFAPCLLFFKIFNQVYENKKFILWIISEEVENYELYDVYKYFMDLIMFWISKMSQFFEDKSAFYIVKLKIDDKKLDFFKKINQKYNIEEIFKYEIENGEIIIHLIPKLLQFFDYENNLHEKQFMKKILKILDIEVDEEEINKIFENKYMMKTICIDSDKKAYMIPVKDENKIKISHSDENIILDEIGIYVLKNLKIGYGKIEDNLIINKVVEYLYEKLVNAISAFDKSKLLEYLYLNYEKIISNLYIRQDYYSNDVSCYPNHEKEIKENYSELNKISVSLKFLIELESSLKTFGDKNVSEYDIEYMLAIASQIIEWAYVGDLLYYHMMTSSIEFLKSNRIGFDHEILNKSSLAIFSAREELLSAKGKEEIERLGKYKPKLNTLDDKEFDKAFICEFGYSFEEYISVVLGLIDYAEENGFIDNICKVDINFFIKKMENKVSKENCLRIIDRISLQERENFLIPSKPYKKEDVYPWRFNREVSLTRRPIIIYRGDIIYGYRNLLNSVKFLLDLINSCKLKANSQEMKIYISKVERIKGKRFNDLVYNYIVDIDNKFIVDKNIKKINRKKITDEFNNDLGDIDILCISESKGIINVIETKDFYLAKNFYEIYNEYKKMFEISDSKSFYNKHMKRVRWVEEHIEDIKMQYKLSNKNWKVTYLFIVDDNLVSKETFNIKVRISTIRKLTKEDLLGN